MKKDFTRVRTWNKTMGVLTPDTFTIPSNTDKYLAVELIIEEAEELRDAATKEDVLDALGDLQFVLYGAMARYGISYEDFDEYFKKICKSNDSKFAATEEEAILSVKKEADRLNLSVRNINYFEQDGRYVIYNIETGKVLKSINYKEPEDF